MLVRDVLLEQKFFKDHEEIDKFLTDHGAGLDTVIQTLIFDKKVFQSKSEVMEWVTTHGFHLDKDIDEDDKSFRVRQMDPSEFIAESIITIEIRRGVSAVIGQLRQIDSDSPFTLSLRNHESIKLIDGLPHIIELAKVISGTHARYGTVTITSDNLKEFVRNFNENSLDVDPSIDFDHETREAAGWIKAMFMSFNEQVLFGEIKWTPKGARALSDREYRYFSPEFTLNYVHPHTGKSHGPTLLGGALVNRPFLKMDAIIELKNKKEGVHIMETISMSEHTAKVSGLEKNISDLKLSEMAGVNSVKALKEEKISLEKEVGELKMEKAKKEKEAMHAKLFSDHKITKAQLTALNEGKGMLEVLSLAEKMNTKAEGKGDKGDTYELSEKELTVCKKLDLTPEEFVKYNKIDEGR